MEERVIKGLVIKKEDLGKWKKVFDHEDGRLCKELLYLKKIYSSKPRVLDGEEVLLCRPSSMINLEKVFSDFSIKYTIIN